MKKILSVLVLAALLIVSAASAGNGSIAVSPSPAIVGDSLVFSGCGYTAGQNVQVQAVHNTKPATYILQIGETVGAGGCFSTADFPYVVPAPGKWTINVSDYNSGHQQAATLNFFVNQ